MDAPTFMRPGRGAARPASLNPRSRLNAKL
jgi:hypothetical protein